MKRVGESEKLPLGFSYHYIRDNAFFRRYFTLYFRWEGKRRRNAVMDVAISPGLTIWIGYHIYKGQYWPRFTGRFHFNYNCYSRQAA